MPVYVLGDMTNGCPWTAEVMDLLIDAGWPMLLGNHDDAVLQLATPRMEPRYADRNRYATLWWTREHLTERHLACLRELPLHLNPRPAGAPPLRLFHGVPGNFFVGFRPGGTAEWAAGRLADVPEETVAGGHTHFPMVRRLGALAGDQRWSVGACYDGDTCASYAWLEGNAGGWQAEIRRVAYDLAKSIVDLSHPDCWPPGE